MARTVRNLLAAASRTAGLVGAGEALSDDDAAIALQELNNLIESWNIDSLFPTTLNEFTFTPPGLVDGEITIGPEVGAVDIETTRPNRIIAVANLRDGRYYPLQYISPDDIARSSVRNNVNQANSSSYYTVYADDEVLRIKCYPFLAATDYTITAQSSVPIYSSFNDEITLPQGYYPALQYALAALLCMDSGNTEMMPIIAEQAKASLARVKRLNSKGRRLSHRGSPGLGEPEFDIQSGSYLR